MREELTVFRGDEGRVVGALGREEVESTVERNAGRHQRHNLEVVEFAGVVGLLVESEEDEEDEEQ